MTEQLSEPQISKVLGIGIRSVKAHLNELVNAHLVDALEETLPPGKKAKVYKVASLARTLGFPPRSYEQLSEALIMGLVSSLGEKSAKMVLRDIGLSVGERLGRSLLADTDSTTLTMNEYAKLVVNRLLVAQKTYPRLLRQRGSEITYEQFNCPYQELADRMPRLVCDVLDEAVHDGLDRALNVKTTRLACKGHGDPSCRFRVTSLGRP